MKILVTGAKGQLGKKLIDMLSSRYELVLTDYDDMDITNPDTVNKRMKAEKPDYVIHGAAYTKVDAAEENEELCRRINSEGTRNIAEAAAAGGATLFYISTDFVFDGVQDSPYSELDKPNPLSVYGQTKHEGEEFVKKFCSKYYILRVAWLFGELPENAMGSNFVETMIRLGKERDSLTVVNDQIGSPTYTKDLVEIIHKIIAGPSDKNLEHKTQALSPIIPYGLYHFSGKGACSWYDFSNKIFRLSNINIDLKPISSDQYPQKARRPAYSYLSKDKIEKALNIQVRDWQEMLKEYLANRI